MTPISSFTGLNTWKAGHKLVLHVYKKTKDFPKEELFGLTNQLRRASVSITSNIAEGFSRKSFSEKLQFYSMSLGSLTEVQNQLLIARDVGYLEKMEFDQMADEAIITSKLLNELIKSTRTIIHNS